MGRGGKDGNPLLEPFGRILSYVCWRGAKTGGCTSEAGGADAAAYLSSVAAEHADASAARAIVVPAQLAESLSQPIAIT